MVSLGLIPGRRHKVGEDHRGTGRLSAIMWQIPIGFVSMSYQWYYSRSLCRCAPICSALSRKPDLTCMCNFMGQHVTTGAENRLAAKRQADLQIQAGHTLPLVLLFSFFLETSAQRKWNGAQGERYGPSRRHWSASLTGCLEVLKQNHPFLHHSSVMMPCAEKLAPVIRGHTFTYRLWAAIRKHLL